MSKYKNTNVLIVDDDEHLANVLNDFLSELGVKSNIANNGIEALEHLAEKEFNIVITDFNMPEMNGLELIKYIKKDEALNDIKIILMTGGCDSELSKALAMADGHMFKPFDFKDLTILIDSLSK